jgi:uncharacterized membrane protein YkvA (DUF1232 family)
MTGTDESALDTTIDIRRHEDFYQRLRDRIERWRRRRGAAGSAVGDVVLLAPDLVHLLIRLALDQRVPNAERTKIAGALAYFMTPLDLLPEAFMGPAGYVDDVVVAAAVLHTVMRTVDQRIVAAHWAGKGELLDTIRTILASAEELVGSGVWERIKRVFGWGDGRLRR